MKTKTVICKLDNRWYWSIESAGLLIESPRGGHVWIKKGAIADPRVSEAAKVLIQLIGQTGSANTIEISIADMHLLLETAKTAKGCFYSVGKTSQSVYTC